jgi:hypothetical protein
MMSSVIFFDRISIEPPYKQIYKRLGFRTRTTDLSLQQKKTTDLFIEEALSLITLKGCALRNSINENDGAEIILDNNLTFSSTKLAAFLRDCHEALLMGATTGVAIMEAIKEKTAKDNLSAAVVYDATASEMADAALGWIMDYTNQQLRREGKKLLPRRFSAGYSDFLLENQKAIYKALQMEKIGVKITSSFILIPEKSVTAITGICG